MQSSKTESETEAKHGRPCGVTVIVNGRPRQVDDKRLSYLEVIDLAFPGEVPTEMICFTVTFSYRNGKGGSLIEGAKSAKVRKDMVFNVTRTDKS